MKKIIQFDEILSSNGKFKGVFALLILFTILSCNREDYTVKEAQLATNDEITFRDGRLIFKDDIAFNNHQRWLFENQDNPQLIAEKNESLGLKSLTEYYYEGMKLDETDPLFAAYVAKYPSVFLKESYDNSTLYLLPHSLTLCYIANKDGFYQISNHIYRIAGKYLYCLNDESKIEMLYLPKDQISDEDIKVLYTRSDAKSDYGQASIYFSNHNFRIVSSLTYYFDYVQQYWDMITNPQHKVLGVWCRAQLYTKTAKGPGVISEPYTHNIPIDSAVNTGLSTICLWYTLPEGTVDETISYEPAYSRGRLDGVYKYVYWDDVFNRTNPTHTYPNYTPATEPF